MAISRRPVDRNEFEIAIICALNVEFDAVDALVDIDWELNQSYGKARGDPNAYRIGTIADHNVVIARLPEMGRKSAATTAAWLSTSFPNIKLGLVVGICGAVPWNSARDEQVMLGDIVISTGIVQYDYGKQYADGVVRKNTLENNLARPTTEIRSFLRILESKKSKRLMQERITLFLDAILKDSEFENCRYPGSAEDKLYEKNYRHKHQDPSICDICAKCSKDIDPVCQQALESPCGMVGCSDDALVDRQPRGTLPNSSHPSPQPALHFGRIASGDLVMKSAYHRDQIASKEGVIAFEMEGAGVWEAFQTVIIKSVCDYADSHKNKLWQQFTAATAAACMKAFLTEWRRTDKLFSFTLSDDTPADVRDSVIDSGANSDQAGLAAPLQREQAIPEISSGNIRDLATKTYKGMTMFKAAEKGPSGFVDTLVKSDIGLADKEGLKLIHSTARGGQLAIVKRLQSLGEDVNVMMDDGWTPMHYAAAMGNVEMLENLRSLGGSIEVRKRSGFALLHVAAARGHPDILSHLHRLGQSLGIKDDDGRAPIHMAAKNGRLTVMRRLKALGDDLSRSTLQGWTPMHYAAKYGHVNILRYLREQGEGINTKTDRGYTPLKIAIRAEQDETRRYLEKQELTPREVDL